MSEAEPASVSPRTPGRRPSTSTAEFIDVLGSQRPALIVVAVGVSLIGAIVALVAPTYLPPHPLAGAAVGFAACALAVAAAVALDAADRVVRGPRHVRGAGAVHVATVGSRGIAPLVDWAEHRLRTEGEIRLAVAGAGVDVLRSGRVTDELAIHLARKGWRVLSVDMHDPNGSDGVAEVVRGDRRLSEVVEYHPTLDLAEVGPGHDLEVALHGFPDLARRLPRDVDALLVAMPGVRQPDVLPAIAAIDGILLLAEAGSTTRVELIAALDALDEVQVVTEVVLLEEDAQLAASVVEPGAVDAPHRVEEPPAPQQSEPEPPAPERAAPEEPAFEEPAFQEPEVEEPAPWESAFEEPEVEEPAPQEPEVEEPAPWESAFEEPAVEEPAFEEPAVEEPAPWEHAFEESAVEEPAVEEPPAEPAVSDDTDELPPISATPPEPEPAPAPEGEAPLPAPSPAPSPESPSPAPPPEAPSPAPPPERGPPREPPRADPLERTPYATDAWKDGTGTDVPREPEQQAEPGQPDDRDVEPGAERESDADREEALRLTATLEQLANEIWAREGESDD